MLFTRQIKLGCNTKQKLASESAIEYAGRGTAGNDILVDSAILVDRAAIVAGPNAAFGLSGAVGRGRTERGT
jgi:hypothetical protein